MSKLTEYREKLNLTQAELAEKSSISIRTIQRIEAGTKPKGHTLRALSEALNINETELWDSPIEDQKINYELVKIINLSSLFFLFPLAISFSLLL